MAHEVRGKPRGKPSSGDFDGEVVSLFFLVGRLHGKKDMVRLKLRWIFLQIWIL